MVEPLSGKRPTTAQPRGTSGTSRCKHILAALRARSTGLLRETENLPAVKFLWVHYFYFLFISLIASLLLWASHTPGSTQGGRLEYVDALFLAVSAQTLAGLNTVDLSTLNTVQQVVLFLLLMLGSVVWVSIWIVHIRKRMFKEKIGRILKEEQVKKGRGNGAEGRGFVLASGQSPTQQNHSLGITEIGRTSSRSVIILPATQPPPSIPNNPPPVPTQTAIPTSKQCAEIGGVEYRALSMLSYIVPAYFLLFQLFGCIGIGWWIARNKPHIPLENGLNPWWMGAFNAVSAFNNSGMSLLDKNMAPFQQSFYVLITMSLLILAGNTCFPIFLRLILWAIYRLTSEKDVKWQHCKETLKFLLDHPRRCFPYLFKARDTWWLAGVVVVLNGIDWAAFEILNIGNPSIEKIPLGPRIMDGLFQAFAVRSGGFQVVPIIDIRIGVQVLYVGMMYISVYPVVMTIRNTNVYEDQSLAIYEKRNYPPSSSSSCTTTRGSTTTPDHLRPFSKRFFLKEQLRSQLAHDLWWLVLAIWVITIIETTNFTRDPVNFSVFNIVFETVSAYGTVGISVGHPEVTYSFCGRWRWASKIVLCAVMLRGRHRGLPREIDSGIMVPGEERLRRVVTERREREEGGEGGEVVAEGLE